jgi:hypothetical protein
VHARALGVARFVQIDFANIGIWLTANGMLKKAGRQYAIAANL